MSDKRFRQVARSSDKRTQAQLEEITDKSDQPAPHASSHSSGGYDPISPADIGAASTTDFQAHTTAGNPHSDSANDTEFQAVKTEVENARDSADTGTTYSDLDARLEDIESRISALEGS